MQHADQIRNFMNPNMRDLHGLIVCRKTTPAHTRRKKPARARTGRGGRGRPLHPSPGRDALVRSRHVKPEEAYQAAETRAASLPPPPGPAETALERLRSDCVSFFGRVPEPPVYARKHDPVREQAKQ